jgi:hypothetical protein
MNLDIILNNVNMDRADSRYLIIAGSDLIKQNYNGNFEVLRTNPIFEKLAYLFGLVKKQNDLMLKTKLYRAKNYNEKHCDVCNCMYVTKYIKKHMESNEHLFNAHKDEILHIFTPLVDDVDYGNKEEVLNLYSSMHNKDLYKCNICKCVLHKNYVYKHYVLEDFKRGLSDFHMN